jgi:hypothetical protein
MNGGDWYDKNLWSIYSKILEEENIIIYEVVI